MQVLTTHDYLKDRRARCYELKAKHQLQVSLSELATDEQLERAVTVELLDRLLERR